MSRMYILYDGRAAGGDTSEASVLVCCETYREAWSERKDYGGASVCYSYRQSGKQLIDERYEFMWFHGEDSQEIRNQVPTSAAKRAKNRLKRQKYRQRLKERKAAARKPRAQQ